MRLTLTIILVTSLLCLNWLMGWAGGSDSKIDVETTGLKLWVGVGVEYMQENSARLATTKRMKT